MIILIEKWLNYFKIALTVVKQTQSQIIESKMEISRVIKDGNEKQTIENVQVIE